ncbi:hypothetical protein IT418_03505 [bacterium]|nr:hypothetical protein [bacterium]
MTEKQNLSPVVITAPGIPSLATEENINEISDPYFLTAESYVLKDPTAPVETPEEAEQIANALRIRLGELGVISDIGTPITARFRGVEPNKFCEVDSIKRRITCFPRSERYLMQDYSLIAHEATHILENDSPTANIGELRASLSAYLLSGRNPYINDRYLFEIKYRIDGKKFIYSVSDFVRAMEAEGITEEELLGFCFNYEQYQQQITDAAIAWISDLDDLSKNSAFLSDIRYKNGKGFLSAVTNNLYGINPFKNKIPPDTIIDQCRANSMPTLDLLKLVGKECILID